MRVADGKGGFILFVEIERCIVACALCLAVGLIGALFIRSQHCQQAIENISTAQHELMEARRDVRIQQAIAGDVSRVDWLVHVLSVLDSVAAQDGRGELRSSLVRLTAAQ